MSETRLPKLDFSLLPAATIPAFGERRDLILGQQAAVATATSGMLYEGVQEKTDSEIEALFGINSDLTNVIFQWIATNKRYSQLWVIPIDDDGVATAATSDLVFGGTTASGAGQLRISVVDEFAYTVTVSAVFGDDITEIGDAFVAALAPLSNIPITAVNALGTVTMTAVNKGPVGNYYSVKISGSIPGITVTANAFTGGATNPTLTGVFDAISESQRVHGVQWPGYWIAENSIVENFLENRFNTENIILRGFAFVGLDDTFANNKAFVDASNSRVIYYMGNNTHHTETNKGSAILRPPDFTAAAFMGIRSRRLTVGAPLDDLVTSQAGVNDRIGGPGLASLPYFNTPLKNTTPPQPTALYSFVEQKELSDSGYTVIGVSPGSASVITGQVVCPYTTDSLGGENLSFHYLNYSDTGDVCSEIFYNTFRSLFSQQRLTDGEVVAGYSMSNRRSIKSAALVIYRDLSELALVERGRAAEIYFSEHTAIAIDKPSGSVFISSLLPIVVQMRRIVYQLQLSFTVDA